jgi:hypothetical protein
VKARYADHKVTFICERFLIRRSTSSITVTATNLTSEHQTCMHCSLATFPQLTTHSWFFIHHHHMSLSTLGSPPPPPGCGRSVTDFWVWGLPWGYTQNGAESTDTYICVVLCISVFTCVYLCLFCVVCCSVFMLLLFVVCCSNSGKISKLQLYNFGLSPPCAFNP